MPLSKPLATTLTLGLLCGFVAGAARAELELPRVSPKATVMQTVGLTDFTVVYCRPGVKNRAVWGDLVPYDKPWRTGANEATTFMCSDSITFGGKRVAPGTYALLTIPGKTEWTVALNREKDLWGAYSYKPESDVLRVKVKPTAAPHEEWMSFTFENLTPRSADLVLRWEKLSVAVPIAVDVDKEGLANSRKAIDDMARDKWRVPYQAAGFSLANETGMEEGEKWLQQSLAVEENYFNLNLLARWRMKQGRKTEAIAAAEKALAAAKASKDTEDVAPTEKLLAEWTAAK